MAKPIAYFIHTFPLFSSTFINDEIDEMRKQGEEIVLFAIRAPIHGEYPAAFQRFRDETVYVFPIRLNQFISRHLKCLFQMPLKYLKLLSEIMLNKQMRTKDKVRTVLHFAEGVYFYPEIIAKGCSHLHVHFLFGNASIAYFLKKLYGLNYTLTAHGSDIFVECVMQKEKLAFARWVRVATEFNAIKLRTNLDPGDSMKIEVIPFGIEKPNIVEVTSRESDGKNIRLIAVGRLIWQKAHHFLLNVCKKLKDEGHVFSLRLVGEGPLRSDLESQIKNLNLEEVVILVGALPRELVWQEYQKADVFVLSSISEGSPIVILEALASGLPVIAPSLHGIPEMFRNGVEGLLFETGSEESLYETLKKIIVDETLRKQLGNAAEILSKQLDHKTSITRFRKGIYAHRTGDE